jgi:hypothetical protein
VHIIPHRNGSGEALIRRSLPCSRLSPPSKYRASITTHRSSSSKNPVLNDLSADELLPIGRQKCAQELKALQAKGVKKLDIDERFKRAGLTNEYESMYTILSAEAHNNVSGLQSRYIDWDETSAWIISYGDASSRCHHYEEPCTLTMSEIVVQSTEKVLALLGHGTAVMSAARSQMEDIWKRAEANDADTHGALKKGETETEN